MSGNETFLENNFIRKASGWQLKEDNVMDFEKDVTFNLENGFDVSGGSKVNTLEEINKAHYSLATLSFIISGSLILPALMLIINCLCKLKREKNRLFNYHQSMYLWISVACLLTSIVYILNLFDNFLRLNAHPKSSHSCYYIYVVKGTLNNLVAVCLCSVVSDILFHILGWGQFCFYNQGRMKLTPFLSLTYVGVFFILNNFAAIIGHVKHSYIILCWRGNTDGYDSKFVGKLDFFIQMTLTTVMILLCLLTILFMKIKLLQNHMVVTPDCILDANIYDAENEVPVAAATEFEDGICHSLTSESGKAVNSDESSDINPAIEDGATSTTKTGENGEKQKCHSKGSKRKSRKLSLHSSCKVKKEKIHADKPSSESSGHANSGYMSDSCDDGLGALVSSMDYSEGTKISKRIKSESDIDISHKPSVKKHLEDHVLDALENFFTMEPGKRIPIPKITINKCDLSENLISHEDDDEDVNNGDVNKEVDNESDSGKVEGETSFIGKKLGYEPLEVKYEGPGEEGGLHGCIELPIDEKKTRVGLKTGSKTEKERKSRNSYSNDHESKCISGEKIGHRRVKSDIVLCGQSVSFCQKGLESEQKSDGSVKATREVFGSSADVMSINAEVDKYQQQDAKDQCYDEVFETDDRLVSDYIEFPRDKDLSWLSVASGISGDSRKSKAIKLENKLNDGDIELKLFDRETRMKMPSVQHGDCEVDTVAGHDDLPNNAEAGIVRHEEETIACIGRQLGHGRRLSEDIKTIEQVEEGTRKRECLSFVDFNKKYLMKPLKDVMCLMLTYICCTVPQLTLDLHRAMAPRPSALSLDYVDGVLSIISDAATSSFLLAVSVVMLWRFKKKPGVACRKTCHKLNT